MFSLVSLYICFNTSEAFSFKIGSDAAIRFSFSNISDSYPSIFEVKVFLSSTNSSFSCKSFDSKIALFTSTTLFLYSLINLL